MTMEKFLGICACIFAACVITVIAIGTAMVVHQAYLDLIGGCR